jgi:hypothetical protein
MVHYTCVQDGHRCWVAAVLLRYLNVGLISRRTFKDQGPTSPLATVNTTAQAQPSLPASCNGTLFARFRYGWYTLWSFRQVNTPYEVKNAPKFSSSDPHYVPPGPTAMMNKNAAITINVEICSVVCMYRVSIRYMPFKCSLDT